MVQLSEILLASDFTARSDRPLDRALQLAAQWRAHLAIVHVLEKDEGDIGDDMIARLRSELPESGSDAELIIERGSVPKILARVAEERQSALLVTGIARYNSLGDYVLGTAVDHIVRNASAPVLVVKHRAGRAYRRLLVATDLSDSSRAALLKALQLFPDADVILLHVYHVPFEGLLKSDDVQTHVRSEAQRELETFLAHPDIAPEYRGRFEAVIAEGEIGGVVAQTLRERQIDLLVVGTNGHSGFFHSAIGSQAEHLLETADCDVLAVRGVKR